MNMKMAYLLLSGAITFEIVATSLLKITDEFTKLIPSTAVVICYAASFYLLSVTLRVMDVGIAYAIWSGIGIVAVTCIAWIVYKQVMDTPALIGMAFIIVGVVVINLFSKTALH